MGKTVTTLLVATNILTGLGFYEFYTLHQKHLQTRTTNQEREIYGSECVDWRNEQTKDRGIKLILARSWKKYGQMVFEVVPAHDQDWTTVTKKVPSSELPAVLCTSDAQSGVMYVVSGDERKKWMFYE
jgi:hypothetical protein